MSIDPDIPVCRRLADGTEFTLRPIRCTDALLEQQFVRCLSAESRYFRFMCQMHELSPQMLSYLTRIDYDRHMAFVATVPAADGEVLIGAARYAVNADGCNCEFAVAVADAWQRRGVGRVLMEAVFEAARRRGLSSMEGLVLRSNRRMLLMAREFGFTIQEIPGDPNNVGIVKRL